MSSKRSSAWQRVSKGRPCPICERPDWCLFAGPQDAPDATICARIESSRRCGEAGWLHILRDDGPTWSLRIRRIELSAARIAVQNIDLGKLATDCSKAVQPDALYRLAADLGVSEQSLTRLGTGWSARHGAWTFPMRDAEGNVLGIRLRCPDGRKFSVHGGKEGVFVPTDLGPGGQLLICEGPTDTAALLDLGFEAVGRPSCMGGMRLLVELVKRLAVPEVVIVADGDAPGLKGAENLAAVLTTYCSAVRIIVPPAGIKDAREWKGKGATAAEVSTMIDAAPVWRLGVKATVRKGKAGGRHE